MTVLYLDLGNTRAKWWDSHTDAVGSLEYLDFAQELKERAGREVHSIVVSSVLSHARYSSIVSGLQAEFGVPVKQCVVLEKALGVRCNYRPLSSLGVDRWLAVLAAWHYTGGAAVVVDLGTAATFDVVSGDGQHQGGFIVNGLRLAVRSLLSGTDSIHPDRDFADFTIELGTSTSEAVYNGALTALVAMIETCYRKALKADSATKLILTGGDAAQIGPLLDCDYERVDRLVFQGMKRLDDTGLSVEYTL